MGKIGNGGSREGKEGVMAIKGKNPLSSWILIMSLSKRIFSTFPFNWWKYAPKLEKNWIFLQYEIFIDGHTMNRCIKYLWLLTPKISP